MNRGQRLVEILKQGQYQPLPVEKQVLIIFAGTNGYLDDLPVEQCRKFEDGALPLRRERAPRLLAEIREKKALDDELNSQDERRDRRSSRRASWRRRRAA